MTKGKRKGRCNNKDGKQGSKRERERDESSPPLPPPSAPRASGRFSGGLGGPAKRERMSSVFARLVSSLVYCYAHGNGLTEDFSLKKKKKNWRLLYRSVEKGTIKIRCFVDTGRGMVLLKVTALLIHARE